MGRLAGAPRARLMRWIARLHDAALHPDQALIWRVDTRSSQTEAAISMVKPSAGDLADAGRPGAADGGAERLIRRRLFKALASRWLEVSPDQVEVRRRASGAIEIAAPERRFASLAARGRRAVLAVGPRPLGVDLEDRPPERPLPLALLHPDEAGALAKLHGAERDIAFLRLWTAKEAYAKATGAALEEILARLWIYTTDGSLRLPPTERACELEVRVEPEFVTAAAILG